MVPISEIFDVRYGSKLDANKLTPDENGVNFVTRSSKNLGVSGRVALVADQSPIPAGTITVTMGGTYLLSAFVQPMEFYTAQNIKILTPKAPMSMAEKAFYCSVIRANRLRYSTHGREANRSFDRLLVPPRSAVPSWVSDVKASHLSLRDEHVEHFPAPKGAAIETVRLDTLFRPANGVHIPASGRSKLRADENFLPYIRPSKLQMTSFSEYVDVRMIDDEAIHPKHTLYVSTNGQGSHTYAYVSGGRFVANTDVTVLAPFRKMSLQEKIYYAAVITANRPRFSYGRKPKGERLLGLLVPSQAPSYIYEGALLAAS